MDSKSRFLTVLKEVLSPLLRDEGFKGSGQNFYRVSEDLIHVINIQGSKWGGAYAVNLGLHPKGMRVEGSSEAPDPKSLKIYQCLFRTRLSKPSESDHWWKHRGFLRSPERAARSLIKYYQRFGSSYFDSYENAKALLRAFDLKVLMRRKYFRIAREEIARGRAAIVGAWLAEHVGDYQKAAELASFAEQNKWERWPFAEEVVRLQRLTQQSDAPK